MPRDVEDKAVLRRAELPLGLLLAGGGVELHQHGRAFEETAAGRFAAADEQGLAAINKGHHAQAAHILQARNGEEHRGVEVADELLRAEIPCLHAALQVAERDDLALGREGHGENFLLRAVLGDELARRGPDANELVAPARREVLAVGRNGEAANPAVVRRGVFPSRLGRVAFVGNGGELAPRVGGVEDFVLGMESDVLHPAIEAGEMRQRHKVNGRFLDLLRVLRGGLLLRLVGKLDIHRRLGFLDDLPAAHGAFHRAGGEEVAARAEARDAELAVVLERLELLGRDEGGGGFRITHTKASLMASMSSWASGSGWLLLLYSTFFESMPSALNQV